MTDINYGFVAKLGNVDGIFKRDWNSINSGDFSVLYNPLPKFEKDKLFFEDEKRVVLLDGVVFNIDELMADLKTKTWKDTFSLLIDSFSKDYMDKLRGSFCGLVYSKKDKVLTAFTNHSGEKTIYYYKSAEGTVFASHPKLLIEFTGHKMKPDLTACREMLVTGSVLNNKTMFDGVCRITAGKYLTTDGNTQHEKYYHIFKNVPEHNLSLDECIEKADILFRNAVDRIFRKNKEYGYQGECDLSGGLDSRMAACVAHDLGYNNILNICYSIKGSLDHKISNQISSDLGNDYHFVPMDSDIIKEIDRKTDLTGGQVLYLLSTGALKALDDIDKNNLGLCCTGLLGEIQNAYWTEGNVHTPANYTSNRKSYFYDLEVPDSYKTDYDNYEQMNLYEYSLHLFMLSVLTRQQITEVTSPFIDVDYLDFVYKVPLKWRKDYLFIMKWMCTKYPKAASYTWQTKMMPVDKYYYKKHYYLKYIYQADTFIVRCFNKISKIFKLHLGLTKVDDMNPIDVWYRTDKDIRNYLKDYYDNSIEYVDDLTLRQQLQKMYTTTTEPTDIIQVINLLAIIKNYC